MVEGLGQAGSPALLVRTAGISRGRAQEGVCPSDFLKSLVRGICGSLIRPEAPGSSGRVLVAGQISHSGVIRPIECAAASFRLVRHAKPFPTLTVRSQISHRRYTSRYPAVQPLSRSIYAVQPNRAYTDPASPAPRNRRIGRIILWSLLETLSPIDYLKQGGR